MNFLGICYRKVPFLPSKFAAQSKQNSIFSDPSQRRPTLTSFTSYITRNHRAECYSIFPKNWVRRKSSNLICITDGITQRVVDVPDDVLTNAEELKESVLDPTKVNPSGAKNEELDSKTTDIPLKSDLVNVSSSFYQEPNEFSDLQIFAFGPSVAIANEICAHLGISLGRVYAHHFADGEAQIKVNDEVRGRDVYIVHTAPPPTSGMNPDSIMIQFFLLIATLRRSSAGKITAVLPYCSYFRQTPTRPISQDKGAVALGAADIAQVMRAMGVDRVIFVDMHTQQAEAFFGDVIPVSNVLPHALSVNYFASKGLRNPVVVGLSPTSGERAKAYWTLLQHAGIPAGLATIATKHGGRKKEPKKHTVSEIYGEIPVIVGEVEGCDCIIVDDMVNTARGVVAAASTLRSHGANRIFSYVTHGLLSPGAVERINGSYLEEIVVTNSIPLPEGVSCDKLRIIPIGKLIGEAIRRVHNNIGISSLYRDAVFDTQVISSSHTQ